MTATAKPIRVVLLDRAMPIIDAPERVMLATMAGLALSAIVLLRVGRKLTHR